MRIRNAVPDDAHAIWRGEYEISATPGLLNARPGEIAEAVFSEKIRSISNGQPGLYIVAEQGDEIAGHLLLDPMPLLANSHVYKLTVAVYPAWQGKGLGRKLLSYAINWAKNAKRVEKIELMVRESNARAIALYERMGFQEEGRIRKRVKTGELYLDDIAMGLLV